MSYGGISQKQQTRGRKGGRGCQSTRNCREHISHDVIFSCGGEVAVLLQRVFASLTSALGTNRTTIENLNEDER